MAFFGLAVLAAGAVVVAVTAPLLVRATQQGSLGAATPATLLAAVVTYGPEVSPSPETGQGAVTPASLWRTAPPVTTTTRTYAWTRVLGGSGSTPQQAFSGHLTASPACAGVRIAAGRCPDDVLQAAVSTASGVPIGSRLRVTGTGQSLLTVVGQYVPDDGGPYRNPLMAAAADTVDLSHGNDLVVDVPTVAEAPDGSWGTVVGVAPAHPLRLEDLPEVRRTLAQARSDLEQVAGGLLATPIDQVLATQRTTAEAASLVSLALAVQTLAVAWAAQALLVGGVARARAAEWGVARLRGFRTRRRLIAVFAEPVAAVLLGSVAGYAVATAVAQAVATATSTSLVQPFQPVPLIIGGLAVLGSLVALVLASVRSATLPLVQLLRERTEPRRIGRVALVAQSGLVLATGLVVYSVLTGGRVTGPQLPLLVPSLVAVTVGLVALRVAVPLLRRRLRPLPRSLTGLLVGRRVIRTPSLLSAAVVLCIAVALATAAMQTWLTSDRLQHQRAQAVVGAARVLEVAVPQGTDLLTAVRRADPSGRLAMAAVDVVDGAGPQRVVAVDTARLAAVSSWHPAWGGMSASRLHRLLAPAAGPSLRIVGRRVEVALADTALAEDPSGVYETRLPDLQLSLTVQSTTGFHVLVLGRMDATRFSQAMPCEAGCRVVGFSIGSRGDGGGPWGVTTDITSLRTDLQPAADTDALLRPQLWRQQVDTSSSLLDPPVVTIAGARQGLAVKVAATESQDRSEIVPRDTPQPVPVLAGPSTTLRPVGGVPRSALASGLGFDSILVRAVGRAAVLPRSLGDGVLVDLDVMREVTDPAAVQGRPQVWLSAAAGPGVVSALQREGLRVIGQQRLAEAEGGFLRETVPRIAMQGAVVGGTGLLLALLALLVSQLLRLPATRATAKVLRAAGAPAGAVRRIAFIEAAAPVIAGALLGAAAGVLGARLLLPSLPLGAGAGALPPLDVGLFWAAAVVPAAVAIAAALLIGALTSSGGRR